MRFPRDLHRVFRSVGFLIIFLHNFSAKTKHCLHKLPFRLNLAFEAEWFAAHTKTDKDDLTAYFMAKARTGAKNYFIYVCAMRYD